MQCIQSLESEPSLRWYYSVARGMEHHRWEVAASGVEWWVYQLVELFVQVEPQLRTHFDFV